MASTDLDGNRVLADGSAPTTEPRGQDTAHGGRGVGLGVTTILGALLVALPVLWAGAYLWQSGASGLGNGFVILMAVALLAVMGAGLLLLRGLFRA